MSAAVLALGLAGVGVTPFVMQSASASVLLDPVVEPCDVGEVCDIVPETTVTVTTTLGSPSPTSTEEDEQPRTTVTRTVTATPTPTRTTRSPRPTKTSDSPTTSAPPSIPTHSLPTQDVEVPVVPPPTPTAPTPEQSVELPTVAPDDPTPSAVPTETEVAASEEVPLELRNAAPEFDQKTLTQQLSIPALVMVLLALFLVLVFEGRLRRMAHAAAVRKAGPQPRPDMMPPGGYPAGPGYAGFPAPGYPGGTAYAPIISFVPVQTYPSAQPPYGPGFPDPTQPYPQQAYEEPPPPADPVVLRPDAFDFSSDSPEPARERDPFEPVIPAEPTPGDIPPGGADPYDGPQPPLGPASAAESGDSEPWEQPGSLFVPKKHGESKKHGEPDASGGYEPPPYLPADLPADPPSAGEVTAVQPLPEPEEQQSGKHKRRKKK
ncbi:hypothetical protein [Nonomuraea maritima]|uniref:hypothetical protein n=1 Tax=Nonomuraea maritima TaxID=683260 RepID=UPI003718B7A5